MNQRYQQLTRKWLGRFSFSFLVVAFFLAWDAYKRYEALGHVADWRIALDGIGATISVLLGFAGLKERHRRDDQNGS